MRVASDEVTARARAASGKFCAIIVSYYPDDGFASRVARIAEQVEKAFLVDNATTGTACQAVEAAGQNAGVEILRNAKNLGVAGGLNAGLDKALQEGFDWAILFDQDSLPDGTLASTLLDLWRALPVHEMPAVLGSNYIDRHRDRPALRCAEGEQICEQKAVIISGTLLSLAAWKAIGPFREEFFMDLVDTDFCYRARRMGYGVYASCEPLMQHAVGHAASHTILGHRLWVSNHPAWRRYLMTRNSLILQAEQGKSGGVWLLRAFGKQFRKSLQVLRYEQDGPAKVKAMWRGFRDGVRRDTRYKPWEQS